MAKLFHIAVDGPVSAGKGTICRLVAEKLNFLYIDTGAMYRVVALLAIKNKINFSNESKLVEILKKSTIEMRNPRGKEKDGRLITILLDNKDVSWEIRTEKVTEGSSKIAIHPKIRKILVKKQQEIAKNQNAIMEGRDITSNVLPNANLKIFLTADPEIRAKRRHTQYLHQGINISLEDVFKDLIERDERESNRKTNPMKIVPDAWVLDNNNLTIEENVDIIVAKTKSMMNEKNN